MRRTVHNKDILYISYRVFQQWEHLPHIVALPIMAGTKHILLNASIKYNSTNIGLDVQQVFCTNQKKRVSVFAGIGASVNFSVISIIRESLDKERGINITTNSTFDYQKNGASLQDAKTDFMVGNTYKIKNSILYQLYLPAGITIRFGNNEKSKLSHFYLSPQIKVGYQLIRFSSNSAFTYVICYASLGATYRF